MGWPSRDDYTTFLDGFFKFDTTFHIVVTVEGIYILNINPCIIKKLKNHYDTISDSDTDKFVDCVDEWADDYINISKTGLTREHGLEAPDGTVIRDEYLYVEFVNNQICKKITCKGKKDCSIKINYPLFHIEFREWPKSIIKNLIKKGVSIKYGRTYGFNAVTTPFRISKFSNNNHCEF